jgi:hypothetical protein
MREINNGIWPPNLTGLAIDFDIAAQIGGLRMAARSQ